MAYDRDLAARVRRRLPGAPAVSERQMFGGVAFLLNGNMCCGVHRQELIVRIDPQHTQRARAQPHVRVFDLSGRPMKGWFLIAADGLAEDNVLTAWVDLCVTFTASLPAKPETA